MPGTFEPNWTAFNENVDTFRDSLIGLTDIGSALNSFLEPLASLVFQVLQVIIYPLGYLLNIFIGVINGTVFPIITFFTNINALGSILYEVLNTFDGVFPSEWTFLLSSMITITIALRIYGLIPLLGGKS